MLWAAKAAKRGIPGGNAAADNSKCVDQRNHALMMLAEKVMPASARVAAATKALTAATKAFL